MNPQNSFDPATADFFQTTNLVRREIPEESLPKFYLKLDDACRASRHDSDFQSYQQQVNEYLTGVLRGKIRELEGRYSGGVIQEMITEGKVRAVESTVEHTYESGGTEMKVVFRFLHEEDFVRFREALHYAMCGHFSREPVPRMSTIAPAPVKPITLEEFLADGAFETI